VAYYLGVDGGGSKTTCAVGDETSRLEIVTAGPSNITRVGKVRAREALHQAIRQACATAKIELRQVQRICIGAAGAGRAEVAAAVREMVAELIPGEIDVVGDMEIALEAAFGTGPGVIVVAGTGSIAYGRDAMGRTTRAGGWGFAISDEGSAHWIGRTTVSAVLRAVDKEVGDEKDIQSVAEALLLFRELKVFWKLHSLDEFVRTVNSNPDFAMLFPSVVTAADAGDSLAQSVLRQAGEELAKLAAIVIRRFFAEDAAGPPAVGLAMVGGVFRHSSQVREEFCNEVRKMHAQITLNANVVEPVIGALQMARRAVRKS
jgi:glucosamine kinase